jgi:hypothetical protein
MLPFSSLFLLTVLLLIVTRCNGVANINFDGTCSNVQRYTITRAFNEMLAMAQVAYDRTVTASEMKSPAGEMRVVANTFYTYFGDPADQKDRLSSVIGRRF